MTNVSLNPVDNGYRTTADESEMRSGSYVDWSCALGGAILAAAMSSLLLAFGSGLGLSMLSPWPTERMNGTLFGVIIIAWTVFVPLLSFAVGGYFAGRLRRPWQLIVSEEIAFRDGAHGALVWAASVVIGAALLASASSGAANMLGSATAIVSQPGMTRMVDNLFRSDKPMDDAMRSMRDEAQRLVGETGSVTLSEADSAYLSSIVATATGLPAADASKRVNDALVQSRTTAETARKAGIVAAFFAAATLLMGLAVAWFAAKRGGEHRDKVMIRPQS